MQGNEQGFSLLEVLVALGVLIILLVSANSLYLAGNQTLVFGAAKSELQQQARVALMKITKEIRKSSEVTSQGQPPQLTLSFEEAEELKIVRYRLNNEGKLIREVKKNQVFKGPTTLANFVQGVEFLTDDNYTGIKLTLAKDKVSLQIQGGAFNRNHPEEPTNGL